MRDPVITFSQNLIGPSKTLGYLEEDVEDKRSGKLVEASDVVYVNMYLFEMF